MRLIKYTEILLSAFLLVSCGGGSSEDTGASQQGPRDSYAVNIQPNSYPPYTCLAPGISTQLVIQKLNSFWKSNVIACACDSLLLVNGCFHNGFVTSYGYGYIYYDRAFLEYLDSYSQSTLPADFFLAHEFGHNIQLALGLNSPGKFKELQADCLAGFYVGYQAWTGQTTQLDVLKSFQFACSIGDSTPSNWWDSTHGVCSERASSMRRGYDGYNQVYFRAKLALELSDQWELYRGERNETSRRFYDRMLCHKPCLCH